MSVEGPPRRPLPEAGHAASGPHVSALARGCVRPIRKARAMTRIEARGATEHGEAVTVAFELDEPCEQGCGGRGMVTHPLWVEFNEADERIRRELGVGYSVSAEHRAWEREWWRERGYTVTVDVGFDRALPPLDVPCEVCDGYGTLLTDSGRELVRFIERSEGRR